LALNTQICFGPEIGKGRELANFIPHSILLQFLLRLANPRHFRMGINHTRNRIVIYVAVFRTYMFRRRDTFLFHLVREHRSESDVADTLDVWHAGVELVLDHDAPPRIDLDTNVIEVEAFDVWPATDGNENNIGIELIRVPDMPSLLATRQLKATHHLLLSVLCWLCRDDRLLRREDFCAHLELEALLSP